MKKRRVLIAAIAVCLIAILACGSLAYFTFTTPKVTNQFYTYSTAEFPNGPTPQQLFSITIHETDANGEKDYDGLTYNEVLPGSTLSKDPTVTNTGKYDAWVRLTVKVTKANEWINAVGRDYDLGTIFQKFNSTDWHRANDPVLENNTLTYVYYSTKPLEAGKSSTLFDGMIIPTELTVEHMIAVSGFQIIIEGDAIQSDNNGTTAVEGFMNWE